MHVVSGNGPNRRSQFTCLRLIMDSQLKPKFGRRHHPPPHNIFFVVFVGLDLKWSFSREPQNELSKLGHIVFWIFGTS